MVKGFWEYTAWLDQENDGKCYSPATFNRKIAPATIRRGRAVNAVAVALGHSDPGLTVRMYADKALELHEAFLDIQEPGETTQRG